MPESNSLGWSYVCNQFLLVLVRANVGKFFPLPKVNLTSNTACIDSSYGGTVLHIAAIGANDTVVDLILKHGADVDIHNMVRLGALDHSNLLDER